MKYPGSKWGSADWIISHFPEHHSYLEPFFGSGGVFFNKPRSDIETINDLDGEVVNLFRQIRNDPERLAREIYFTPYSREAYEMVRYFIPIGNYCFFPGISILKCNSAYFICIQRENRRTFSCIKLCFLASSKANRNR